MVRMRLFALALLVLAFASSAVYSATTKQILSSEGWRGLFCTTCIPDCICQWCCPDYCKKPLPCMCGPLPPGLSCGCGSEYGCGSYGGYGCNCGCGYAQQPSGDGASTCDYNSSSGCTVVTSSQIAGPDEVLQPVAVVPKLELIEGAVVQPAEFAVGK